MGASPTFRVVLLCKCSKMFMGITSFWCGGGSSRTPSETISIIGSVGQARPPLLDEVNDVDDAEEDAAGA
jgi:hypothetical protein